MSARTLPEKYDVFFPAYTSAGNYLGRFWNIGISARTFPEKYDVLFPAYTSAGKYLGKFWNIGMSARTFPEKFGGNHRRVSGFTCITIRGRVLVNSLMQRT